ncbi:hypothetical protein ANO11243_052510 [Dothideomycetidae sp. 11243]|nr:hypothetical protein ANO11243_052510 [fungal sp. No.11243]
MHSLALYAQIPSSRHAQVLNILAGLTGTQPRETHVHTLIFAPLRTTSDTNVISKKTSAASQQNQQLSYIQLDSELSRTDFGHSTSDEGDFTVTTQDTPEPETRNLVLRHVSVEGTRLTRAEAKGRFGEEGKYKRTDWTRFITEYVQDGHVMVHNDVVLRLRRVLCFKPTPDGTAGLDQDALPPLDDFVLLDSSGAWMLEAMVRIEDRGKPALVRAASEQLLGLRAELRGAIELRVPERLAMDTRIKA